MTAPFNMIRLCRIDYKSNCIKWIAMRRILISLFFSPCHSISIFCLVSVHSERSFKVTHIQCQLAANQTCALIFIQCHGLSILVMSGVVVHYLFIGLHFFVFILSSGSSYLLRFFSTFIPTFKSISIVQIYSKKSILSAVFVTHSLENSLKRKMSIIIPSNNTSNMLNDSVISCTIRSIICVVLFLLLCCCNG